MVVSAPSRISTLLSYLTLARSRGLLAARGSRAMGVFLGVAYGLFSMLIGGMLWLAPYRGPSEVLVLWSGNGTQPWNYPGLLVTAPWGVLALPFVPTIAMVLVSAGVGLGMSVSILLLVRLVRMRRRELGRPAALSSATGLTPVMVAVLTLGACCSTTAAATAGLAVVAQSSGTTVDTLLANTWYVSVFQVVVLYVALLAQEELLAIYGVLFEPDRAGTPSAAPPVLAPPRPRLAFGALRVVLVAAGLTWSLAVPAAWTQIGPSAAPVGWWISWLFQHLLLGGMAVAAGLFPRGFVQLLLRPSPAGWLRLLRWAVGLSAAAVLIGTPPPIAGGGLPGLVNELLGALGAPATWGAVSPGGSPGLALFLRWGFQFGLLGGFGVLFGLRPETLARAFRAPERASSPRASSAADLSAPAVGRSGPT